MRRYLISLLSLTLLLVLASFVVLWTAPQNFIVAMPLLALYFALVYGGEHFLIIRSAQKDPRTFVRNFLGITVGTIMLHLIVLVVCMFTRPANAKLVAVAFLIGMACFLTFETIALVRFVKQAQK